MIAPAGQPRGLRPDPLDDAAVVRTRRARLMHLLTIVGALPVVVIVVALFMTPELRHTYVVSICFILVLSGALPLFATLLQYSLVGLNRFYIGYEDLRPWYPRVAIVVPAWNEAAVIGTTIERLLSMDYPQDRLRVYVVDDASTDATPEIVGTWASRFPERVRHLRRDTGGQGKAHTLNHGIAHILSEPWSEAVLIIDADVLFEDSALRRMARHLSRPGVGAVTAYIKEGTANGNYLTRFIAYEYITAQAAARRAQNVLGALACLAGGAQLHSRENLVAIGGRIDTSSLAEDTVTTFRTQLSGKRVVFEGNAVVWAEEPADLVGLWKQRLRWARGNAQISLQFSHMWLRGRRYGALGRELFAFNWFTVLLMPVFMTATSPALLTLYFIDAPLAWTAFRGLWIFHAVAYVVVIAISFGLDPWTARRAWLQGILFPGAISLFVIIYSVAPGPIATLMTDAVGRIGIDVTPRVGQAAQLFVYGWLTGSMGVAYAAKWIASHSRMDLPPKVLLYLAGYGAFLCSVTFAAYIRELQGAGLAWDKTIKTGRAVAAR